MVGKRSPPGSVGVSSAEMAAKMAALPGKSGGVNAYVLEAPAFGITTFSSLKYN